MLEKLMPKSDDFFSDFEAQAATVVEGAKLLKALLDDFTDVPRKCQAIKDVEHRGDDITHKAFARLHTQFITPFDRSEIHRLLSRIDDVLDLADAASERLGLYDVDTVRSEEHTSELQSRRDLVCRLLLEKKKADSKESWRDQMQDKDEEQIA